MILKTNLNRAGRRVSHISAWKEHSHGKGGFLWHHFRPLHDHKLPALAVRYATVERKFEIHTTVFQATVRFMLFVTT